MAKTGMKKFNYLFHSIIFYSTWFGCIALVVRDYAWLASWVVMVGVVLQLYWQYRIQHHTEGLWIFMGLLVLCNALIDSLLIYNHIIIYTANPFAPYITSPWVITLWISLSIVLYATFSKFFDRLVLLGLLSFTGFVLSYASGAKMGAAFYPYGYKTCFLIGAIWLIALPFVVYCYKKIMGRCTCL